MFINTKKTIKIKSDNGTVFEAKAGWIGEVPQWVEKHWYFEALCKDGSVTAIVSKKDKDIAAAVEGTAQDEPPAGDKAAEPSKADDGNAAPDDKPPVDVGTKGKGAK